MYLQADYSNFTQLREAIVREAEEATARGELVRSARRFVEELARTRIPYARQVEILLEQVRLAKEQRDHQWLKRVAQIAHQQG
ncbi:MAG: hypothetical protein JAY75_19820, partial [Candidatus Thiodiazotropha taylori]|nr:hypothetical protein [Candidatus Thiodiazotropha taylori]MCW4310469.1 hypothetical protein [Candidatus Thiodiazotropha endolucinida]